MRKAIAIIIAAAFVASMLCGCKGEAGDVSRLPTVDYPVTAFDKTVDACPQRVVSLSPAVTDIILELGSDAQLAGVSDFCRTDKEIARCGTSLRPDIEQIKALDADVVFTTTALSDSYKAEIEALGATLLKVNAANGYTELLSLYTGIASVMSGGITGPRNASNTFSRLDGQLKSVNSKSKDKVSVAVYFSDNLLIPTGGLADDLISLSGGKNICKSGTDSDATVLKAKPQVILCPTDSVEAFKARFESIRVEGFDPACLEVHGGGMVDTVKQLHDLLKG